MRVTGDRVRAAGDCTHKRQTPLNRKKREFS